MNVTAMEVSSRKTISAPPCGICISRAWKSEKPKPAVRIEVNYSLY